MMLRNLFGQKQPEAKPRTSVEVRAEIDIADGQVHDLATKIADARNGVATERTTYAYALESFANGTALEPSRSGLEAAMTKLDTLAVIDKDLRDRISTLKSEWRALELAEAIATGREVLPALVATAESHLEQFEAAVITAGKIEAELFATLFDQRSGLKQRFAGGLDGEAARARAVLRKRVAEIAKKARFSVNPEFETDGNLNYGCQEPWYQARLAAPVKNPHCYNPKDYGELVSEVLDHESRPARPVAAW